MMQSDFGGIGSPFRGARFFGKYKAFVRANDDPEKRGRVRCFCPQVMGELDVEQNWLDWATPCHPWLGGLSTVHSGPPRTKAQNGGKEVGVYLEFEAGHPDFPVLVGTFPVAPTPSDEGAQNPLENAAGSVGGSILDNPPAGSEVDDLNPPIPNPDSAEIRLLVKEGQEIIIGVQNGGYIVIGPGGVHIVGDNVSLNGRHTIASPSVAVFG